MDTIIVGLLIVGFFFYITRPFWLAKKAGMSNRGALGCLILFFVIAYIAYALGLLE